MTYSKSFASKCKDTDFNVPRFLKLKKKSQLKGNKNLLNTRTAIANKQLLSIQIKTKKLDSDLVKLGKMKNNKW